MDQLNIDKIKDLFFTHGLKSITMEDVAQKTGISKKTLYQIVADKNELVGQVVEKLINEHRLILEESSNRAENAIDETLIHSILYSDIQSCINARFFYDLERAFPSEWEKLTLFSETILTPAISKNIQRGLSEEFYREDINISFVTALRLHQFVTLVQPNTFPKRFQGSEDVMKMLTEFYLNGIVSQKGRKILNKYLNKHEG